MNTGRLSVAPWGRQAFTCGEGGGLIEPPGKPPLPPPKGSIDGTPKILLRLTSGPRRWP